MPDSGDERDGSAGRSVFTEIRNLPLRDQIAEKLRDAILAGELRPGEAVVETTIAAQFGVSRAPVREAIRILEQEGVLEVVPYRGTTVRMLTRHDVDELYSFRTMLEEFAIRRVIDHADPTVVKELWAICHHMEQLARDGDWKSVNEEDEHFHDSLVRAAGHSLLSASWNMLSLRVRQAMALRNKKNATPLDVAMNHPPIVRAIEVGDREEAARLIRDHIATTLDLWLEQAEPEPR